MGGGEKHVAFCNVFISPFWKGIISREKDFSIIRNIIGFREARDLWLEVR